MLSAHPHSLAGGSSAFCPQRLDTGVFVGPAPKSLADIAYLKSLGVLTIIDNRSVRRLASNREARWARGCGLSHFSLPVQTRPSYPDCNLEKTLARMRERRGGGVYVHCSLGRDRTGLIAALYRYRHLGWSAKKAFCEMQRGEYNPRLVELDHYFWQSVKCSFAAVYSK